MTGQPSKRCRRLLILLLLLFGFLEPSRARAATADRGATLDDMPSLLRQLDYGQADLSYEAARRLALLGPNALQGAMPELERLARCSTYVHTRVWAVELSDGLAPTQDPDAIRQAVQIFRRGSGDPIADIRGEIERDFQPSRQQPAVAARPGDFLTSDPPDWNRAIPIWIDVLGNDDPDARFLAAQSLAASAPHDPKGIAVEPLSAALNSDDNAFRVEVAAALGGYGRAAASAAPALSRMADNADPAVRFAAVRALLRIDAPVGNLVSALMASILQRDDCCCDALVARIGHKAATKLMLQLTEMSRSDPDPRVRALAAEAEDSFARTN